MKAITLIRPWAELVVCGLKTVENRTWATPYRGRLVIHAGRKYDYDWTEKLPMGLAIRALNHFNATIPADLTETGIVGVVDVYDCTKAVSSGWHEKGNYGWYLRNPIKFKHAIDTSGKQGLWNVPITMIVKAMTE